MAAPGTRRCVDRGLLPGVRSGVGFPLLFLVGAVVHEKTVGGMPPSTTGGWFVKALVAAMMTERFAHRPAGPARTTVAGPSVRPNRRGVSVEIRCPHPTWC